MKFVIVVVEILNFECAGFDNDNLLNNQYTAFVAMVVIRSVSPNLLKLYVDAI